MVFFHKWCTPYHCLPKIMYHNIYLYNYIILLYLYAYLFDCEMCQYTYSINDVKMVKPVHLFRCSELLFDKKTQLPTRKISAPGAEQLLESD